MPKSILNTTPEYLYQTSTGLFIFRMRVPQDCRSAVGKTELRYSLKTRCIRTAREQLARILRPLNNLFKEIQLGVHTKSSPEYFSKVVKRVVMLARTPLTFPPHQYLGVRWSNKNGHFPYAAFFSSITFSN